MHRHRVNERGVVTVAMLAAVAAVLFGAEPTGSAPIDVALVGGAVAVTTWSGGTAPWWTVSVLAAAATAISTSWVSVPIGLVALAASWWVGAEQRDLSVERSVITGVACLLLLSSGLGGFHGLSAVIAILSSLPLVALGLRRRRTRASRTVAIGFAVIGVVAVAATIGTGLAARSARSDLAVGQALATDAIAAVQAGEYLQASALFVEASDEFDRAHSTLSKPWAGAGALVPVVSQNRRAVTDLSERAAASSQALAAALAVVDPEQLRLEGGRLDLDVVTILSQPFATIRGELAALDDSIESIESPWLLAPIAARLDDLRRDLDANRPGLDAASDALTLAPRLLGGDGVRHYFVAVTTPAEARGLTGFMGNWLELTAQDGQLSVSRSGRTLDLNRAGGAGRTVSGPDDWLEQFGRFGFDSVGGTIAADPWSNITLSADFAATAQVIAELYPQSGGRDVDGVFSLDPEVVGALLAYTGPIAVEGAATVLDSSNVVEFLLVDQYATTDDEERIDLLEDVSEAAITQVFGGALPNPAIVARDLGPLVREGRLLGWAADPDEQELFREIGLSGELPAIDGGDGIGLVFTNVGANKLDAYLGRQTSYRATFDDSTGTVAGTLTVEVTNGGPTTGFLDGAIGNYSGDPIGTNRTRLSIYSALPLTNIEVDGVSAATRPGAEADWTINSLTLSIPPGDTVELSIEFDGPIATEDGEYRLVTFTQPLALDLNRSISVRDASGVEVAFSAGLGSGVERFSGSDPAAPAVPDELRNDMTDG